MVARSPINKWLLSPTSWIIWGCVSVGNGVGAQVIPDQTLPVGEESQVSGDFNIQIDGGATRGNNLFHSFQSFSIPTESSAFFNNAPQIQNIFSRVTGGSISNIDGIIQANGTANLFLLNPNGIVFGPNARLNIGGSFVVSTANSINFADGFHFSATNPQTSPLLTISAPIGLQVGTNPGRIVVQGNGYDLSKPVVNAPTGFLADDTSQGVTRVRRVTGLRVLPNNTLALVGREVELANGTLQAEQGRVELGSARNGQVGLSAASSGWALSYEGVEQFGDIRLLQRSLVDASGGGTIQIQGNQVSLINGALALIQNQGNQQGGSIRVNARTLELIGINSNLPYVGSLRTETTGNGQVGDIAVSAQHLLLQDGAAIASLSYGAGRAGDITLSVTGKLQVLGFAASNVGQNSLIASTVYGSGDTGDLTIGAGRLALLQGGAITLSARSGRSGNAIVNATESIEVSGAGPVRLSNITVRATRSGKSGDLTINTSRFAIRDGGTVGSFASRAGNGGNVTVNASESVDISGTVQIPAFVELFRSRMTTSAEAIRLPAQLVLPTGISGDLTINTNRLNITDGARIEVNHEGTGNAGRLRVNANSIFLDRDGQLEATTVSGQGGDINLQVRDALLMRRNSQITTSAGGVGSGGNIIIDTASLVAAPLENSDIRADSVNARGGNVTINTNGLFGIQFRNQNTSLSDITATGANSALDGTVQLDINRVDPTSGLVQLPVELVDVSGLVAQGCRDVGGSSFVVTGRGGLPPTPQQPWSHDPLWQDWRTPAVASTQPNTPAHRQVQSSSHSTTTQLIPTALVEATGWAIAPNGKIVLTATAPDATSYRPWTQPAKCNGS